MGSNTQCIEPGNSRGSGTPIWKRIIMAATWDGNGHSAEVANQLFSANARAGGLRLRVRKKSVGK